MKISKIKTAIISLSENELKQLALVGINSIIQTGEMSIGKSDEEIKEGYKNISKCCASVDIITCGMLHKINLSACDKVKIEIIK